MDPTEARKLSLDDQVSGLAGGSFSDRLSTGTVRSALLGGVQMPATPTQCMGQGKGHYASTTSFCDCTLSLCIFGEPLVEQAQSQRKRGLWFQEPRRALSADGEVETSGFQVLQLRATLSGNPCPESFHNALNKAYGLNSKKDPNVI